ncbi:MAG: WYL domain-containing protein [Erysipelotrichaceae bacterium]|nr:WYL domain-containing protein [Erysipelotrichaceae bacterium]
MENNNRKRLLLILEFLKKNSDADNRVSREDISSYLENEGLNPPNRKTIYEDIKLLNSMGYDIEYDDKGYYLLEAPFSLSEIKIIQDSLNSLKNFDIDLLHNLNDKLYSFISYNEEMILDKLSYQSKHKDKKLLQRLDLILEAINSKVAIIIKRKNNNKEKIYPIFLHRSNDYYYFYYHYENNDSIYHYRFDNILDLSLTDEVDSISISKNLILENIEASSNSFYKGKSESVTLLVKDEKEYIHERLIDDFPNAIKTKDGYSIKVNINNIFFSKLVSYGKSIVIKEKDITKRYQNFLYDILNNYLPEK